MAWSTPRTWVTGELVTASMMNTDVRDNMTALRGGALALPSQAALDFIFGLSNNQFGRLAKGTGLQFPRMNAAANAWEMTDGPFKLLRSGTGSAASGGGVPVTLDSFSVSGLTALDKLIVITTNSNQTGNTANDVVAYHAGDSLTLWNAGAGGNNQNLQTFGVIGVDAQDGTAKRVSSVGLKVAGAGGFGSTVLTTAWTATWTMELRVMVQITSGTHLWTWLVLKWAGQ